MGRAFIFHAETQIGAGRFSARIGRFSSLSCLHPARLGRGMGKPLRLMVICADEVQLSYFDPQAGGALGSRVIQAGDASSVAQRRGGCAQTRTGNSGS